VSVFVPPATGYVDDAKELAKEAVKVKSAKGNPKDIADQATALMTSVLAVEGDCGDALYSVRDRHGDAATARDNAMKLKQLSKEDSDKHMGLLVNKAFSINQKVMLASSNVRKVLMLTLKQFPDSVEAQQALQAVESAKVQFKKGSTT
jgi:hypothetical protein